MLDWVPKLFVGFSNVHCIDVNKVRARYVQDSSNAEIRHITYRISSPARDSEIFFKTKWLAWPGIELGISRTADGRSNHYTTPAWLIFSKKFGLIKVGQNGLHFILDSAWVRVRMLKMILKVFSQHKCLNSVTLFKP